MVICPLLVAQQALNNDSVIKLVKAGLSEDLIVTTISGATGNYDISADGIIALKTAGVSDKVVAAIVAKGSAPAPTPTVYLLKTMPHRHLRITIRTILISHTIRESICTPKARMGW